MIVKLAEKFVVGFVYSDRACNANALIEKCFDSERIRKDDPYQPKLSDGESLT